MKKRKISSLFENRMAIKKNAPVNRTHKECAGWSPRNNNHPRGDARERLEELFLQSSQEITMKTILQTLNQQ